jgi:two-component sensor histidine kinase
VGLPADIDAKNTTTLGFQVVSLLTEQLGGELRTERGHGTTVAITFKEISDNCKT